MLLATAACASLAACDDFTLVAVTATPNLAALPSLPPIGFNHRYGNTPVASSDAFQLERAMFSKGVYWEVAIRMDPVLSGYVPLGDKSKVEAARHAAKDLYLIIATENVNTIEGLLAYRSDSGQEAYCEALLDAVRADGYDAITSGYVLVYFTESDEHAKLSWSRGGYSFAVYDNDLRGTRLTPGPSATPLPSQPPAPAPPG